MNYIKNGAGNYVISSEGNTIFDVEIINKIIKEAKQEKAEKIIISFKEGRYFLDRSLIIEEISNITLKTDENARFIGGRILQNIKKVEDKKQKERFDITVKDMVYECDLSQNGVEEVAPLTSRGFARSVVPSHAEIFIDGKPLNLSQYPEKGKYLKITGYCEDDIVNDNVMGKLESGFYYNDQRPKGWADSEDIWLNGYWAYDWANSYEHIFSIDKEKMLIKNDGKCGNYGFVVDQRFCFINILEEVIKPGDYYIDRHSKKLYFIPFEENFQEVIISTMEEPMMIIEKGENVTFDGLTFECSRSSGLKLHKSNNAHVNNCNCYNMGNYAIEAIGGLNFTIEGCTIHDCGDGGIFATGGNRKTLAPANININNNHIYNIAKWSKCYQTAIRVEGVGITVKNNLIHDLPHTGVLYLGNEITIEKNELYNCVMETGDAGAIYSGLEFTNRGIDISRNYIHHLGGVGLGAMGIYNDGGMCGVKMEENIFLEVSRAICMTSGRDMIARNNILVNCYPAILANGTTTSIPWRSLYQGIVKDRFYKLNLLEHHADINDDDSKEEISAMNPIYLERYPELKIIDEFYKTIEFIPPKMLIENNYISSKRTIELIEEYERGEFILRGNFFALKDEFVDTKKCDFRVKTDSHAYFYGFHEVKTDDIGLIEEKRRINPVNVSSYLEYDKESLKLKLYMFNIGDKEATGKMNFFYEGNIDKFNSINFKLLGNSETCFEIDYPMPKEATVIDARSLTAGIRPSRVLI